MVKSKKSKSKGNRNSSGSSQNAKSNKSSSSGGGSGGSGGNYQNGTNSNNNGSAGGGSGNNRNNSNNNNKKENLDTLEWLRCCEMRRDQEGEPYLQLEYQEDDELMLLLQQFLEESAATKQIVQDLYQIWQQTVLSTLLASTALWKKPNVTSADQRQMKDQLKQARYKINFIMHHAVGQMLTCSHKKWKERRPDLQQLCFQTLQLLPRLAESCPHHKTDIRQVIIHFEGKEFLAAVACETWDTLYDYSIPIDASKFIPILRRCAMLDILDKDWNMLGGWEDILKGLEAKCCVTGPVQRLPCDTVLHEHTTILRNARNSMQCKFFSVRFMRYTEDQAPQRWRYFPKCSAPACANIETPDKPHPHRCHKCWYFHYCSAACQDYCDNIMGLHPKFCRDTPSVKATLCQKETSQYLQWPSSAKDAATDPAAASLVCHACGMSEWAMTAAAADATVDGGSDASAAAAAAAAAAAVSSSSKGTASSASTKCRPCGNNNNNNNNNKNMQMKRCSKCQKVYYCSRQCQEWDWRMGGHKLQCKTVCQQQQEAEAAAEAVKDLN